ncbi:copper transporter 3-like [Haliotis rubra]|uniref:copper transporter 3-like n=1 Tax=Haliotis rubra TaxID=36100 RepID=UPI001EE55532|nr:copper transporter 3-like [Haliotis rubra]
MVTDIHLVDDLTHNDARSHDHITHHKMYLAGSTTLPFFGQTWDPDSVQALVAVSLVSAVVTVFFEVISGYFFYQELTVSFSSTQRQRRNLHVCLTCLYVVRVVVSYLLMLAVMSFNVWIFVCVILGSAIGYFTVQPVLRYYNFRRMLQRGHVTGTNDRNRQMMETDPLRPHHESDETPMVTRQNECVK